RITKHVRECISLRNVGSALADGDHQFAFVMQVGSAGRIRHATLRDNGIGRLQEKTHGGARSLGAHFTDMCRIVFADTVNAVDRKQGVNPADGNGRTGPGWKSQSHERILRYSGLYLCYNSDGEGACK